MDHRHFDTVRLTINPKLDTRRMFAEWRVEAPWKPWTRKAVGFRHGGGKGPIDRYVTPIRANRIILELGAARRPSTHFLLFSLNLQSNLEINYTRILRNIL